MSYPYVEKFSTWTKFSHVEIEFIRLEICTLYTLSYIQTPHSNTLSLSVSQTLSQSSNTLIQTPKSVTLNPSACNKTHPHSQTLSSFLTIGFRRSPHPLLFPHNRLQTIPSPIPSKSLCPYQRNFRFFQV